MVPSVAIVGKAGVVDSAKDYTQTRPSFPSTRYCAIALSRPYLASSICGQCDTLCPSKLTSSLEVPAHYAKPVMLERQFEPLIQMTEQAHT
jgi:hypothetical protein